ncbi:MAG: hypothetical protein K8L97_19110 [Anaerolineae bacterium]|nr:hypothetical protein [Anaerolineae bacterium]
MVFLWLGFMGLFLVALIAPLAQRLGYASGRTALQIAVGVAVTIIAVVLFSGALGTIGYLALGPLAAFGVGLTAAFIGFVAIAIFGLRTPVRR